MNLSFETNPAAAGYYFPAEFAPHSATWLSWPHKEASWPGKLDSIYEVYATFVKYVSAGELVKINVSDAEMEKTARQWLKSVGADIHRIRFFHHPTNDAWCRDHGPAYLVKAGEQPNKIIVDWGYNAWGGKYPPFDLDDVIPTKIGAAEGIPVVSPGIVMEGGSVDFNGAGTVLTTRSCLLNPNRNPHLSQEQIEDFLRKFYGVEQVLWLDEGIVGDDTDGHIDDITRFVNVDTVVTAVEEDPADENYEILQKNLQELKQMRLLSGKPLNVIELPMPHAVIYEDTRLPASYANFYIANDCVVVPTFRDAKNDSKALEILKPLFPDRNVIGLDSTDIIWGLGSFHCLSQQEPAV